MAKIILQISYDVQPDKRDSYLALAKSMKTYFAEEKKKNYSIYEMKGRPNTFIEEFVCASPEEYDILEDDTTERAEELVNQLTSMLKEGKTRYATMVEIV